VNSAVLLANLASTLFLTGLAWSLQFVQLPILLSGDDPELTSRLVRHRVLNTRLMVLPMALEFVTSAWLAWTARTALLLIAFLLWCVIGYATVWYSLLHRKPRTGLKKPAMDRLKRWNWVRTLCWTARSAILLWIVMGEFRI
jgi:hypothetical protein